MELQERVDVQTGFIDTFWNQKILPTLEEYITLKCISRNYDPNWPETLPVAAKLIQDWVVKLNIPGAQVKLATAAGRTPFLLIDLPGTVDKTVLLYGHFDKQPAGPGWTVTDPWTPKVVGDRLYGRGA
ncbi:MAG TPA: peptidase M20, partial [Thermoanaerobaculia bacterium]